MQSIRSIGKKEILKLKVAHHMCQLGKFYLRKKIKEAKTVAKIKKYESYDRINFTSRSIMHRFKR